MKVFSFPGSADSIVRTAPNRASNIPCMISAGSVLRFPGRFVSVVFAASNAEAVDACSAGATGATPWMDI